MDTPLQALQAAVDSLGHTGQTELAARITLLLKDHPNPWVRGRRVTQAHVAMWLSRGRAAGYACGAIETVTGIPRTQLRPDLFYTD